MVYRLACDSDNVSALVQTPLVFTYADLFRTEQELQNLKARFPLSRVKLIHRGLGDPLGKATIVDIEHGALTMKQGEQFMRQWVAEKRPFPTAYFNRSEMSAIDSALKDLKGWWRWIATLDGTMRVPQHPNAMVQFANAAMAGTHVDMSIVYWPQYEPTS
jgi:hypothetical protein